MNDISLEHAALCWYDCQMLHCFQIIVIPVPDIHLLLFAEENDTVKNYTYVEDDPAINFGQSIRLTDVDSQIIFCFLYMTSKLTLVVYNCSIVMLGIVSQSLKLNVAPIIFSFLSLCKCYK